MEDTEQEMLKILELRKQYPELKLSEVIDKLQQGTLPSINGKVNK